MTMMIWENIERAKLFSFLVRNSTFKFAIIIFYAVSMFINQSTESIDYKKKICLEISEERRKFNSLSLRRSVSFSSKQKTLQILVKEKNRR